MRIEIYDSNLSGPLSSCASSVRCHSIGGRNCRSQALQRSIMLSELLSGQKIPLNDPQFYGYAQVCLVGYDLIGEPLQRCKGSKENTVLAVPVSNASCMEFVGPEDLKGRKLNVLMGGEAYCKDFGSNSSLSIAPGVERSNP